MFRVRNAGPVVRVSLAVLALACATASRAHAQVPSPWAARDIGSPTPAGSSSFTSGTFSIDAGGADIWGTSDKFHFIYQQISGDTEIKARVDSVTNADEWSKSGVMIRASLSANSAHAFALVSSGKGLAFQRRTANGGQSANTSGGSSGPPRWVRLVRSGTRVTAYVSSTGTTWTTIGSATIALGSTAYVGIATTSHNSNLATSVDVSNVTVGSGTGDGGDTGGGGGSGALPSPLKDADVGSPSIAGAVSDTSGTFTIKGAGRDIWDTSDQFNYVYEPATGDVDVSARIASITNTDPWAKAAVMIRDTLNANARHASAFLSYRNGYQFSKRVQTGGSTASIAGSTAAAPGWVRIKRNGSLFTAYQSTDGKTWTVIGSETITMGSTVFVGIAVTSHNTAAATTVVASNLSVSAAQPTDQPPTVSLTAPANGSTFTAPATIAMSANASDPEGKLARVEFYAGSTLVSTDTSAPYAASWSSVPAGTYSLTAVAYDTGGQRGTSAAVSVTVGGSTTTPPRGVVFHASADHATLVTSYRLDVFAANANPSTATPIATANLGKPTPDGNGDITAVQTSLFNGLAAGSYQVTVTAIGSSGNTRSTAVTFTK